MIRLPPSEICLTPEDVDETFRRIAQRQALRGPRRGSSQPGRPALHRGPQRFVRDAITTLGDIPLLRPQPQQAILSSLDDEVQDDAEQEDNLSSASPLQHGHSPSVPANTPTNSPLRVLQLPFRIGRPHRDAHRQQHGEDSQADNSTSPLAHPQTPNVGDGNTTADLDASGEHTPRTPALSPGPAELRGGGRARKRDRHGSSRDSFSTPSPTRQRQQDDSDLGSLTPQGHPPSNVADGDTPTLYLKGYFTDPAKHPKGPEYWFREFARVPQTEPRRASGRHVVPERSLSSGNASSRASAAVRQAIGTSSSEDVFRACDDDLDSVDRLRQGAIVNPRQFSSEASSSSVAYSFYQMPADSRNSSGHNSEGMDHSLSQYDGTAASRQVNRGAYHSIRQSDLDSYRQVPQHDRPDAGNGGRHGVSPLPVRPYTRVNSTHVDHQAPTGTHMDAGTAAVQGLPSPLEPFAVHYQQIMDAQNDQQGNPWAAPRSLPNHNVGGRHSNSHAHGRQAIDRLPQQFPAHHYPATSSPPTSSPPASTLPTAHVPGRSAQSTRANQRSSENAPVRPSAQRSGPSRNSQVQIHRAAFERLHNAIPANTSSSPDLPQPGPSRLSLPHPPPQNTSNRPHTHAIHAAASRRRTPQSSSSPPQQVAQSLAPFHRTSAPPASLDFPTYMPPRHSSDAREAAYRPGLRHAHRTTRGARSPPQFRPARGPDGVSALSSLRSSGVIAATSRPPRRVPPPQLDQENSGAGEEELMRREADAIRARHSEEVRDAVVMDETPPRVGRVERRMFS